MAAHGEDGNGLRLEKIARFFQVPSQQYSGQNLENYHLPRRTDAKRDIVAKKVKPIGIMLWKACNTPHCNLSHKGDCVASCRKVG